MGSAASLQSYAMKTYYIYWLTLQAACQGVRVDSGVAGRYPAFLHHIHKPGHQWQERFKTKTNKQVQNA